MSEGRLVLHDHFDLAPSKRALRHPASPLSLNYSNINNSLGQAHANGSATTVGAYTKTLLVADDVSLGIPMQTFPFGYFFFTVTNQGTAPVRARPTVIFYRDEAGAPGRMISGINFNPIDFAPGVDIYESFFEFFGLPQPVTAFWAGLLFDNVDGPTGVTGATAEELDQLGQGSSIHRTLARQWIESSSARTRATTHRTIPSAPSCRLHSPASTQTSAGSS